MLEKDAQINNDVLFAHAERIRDEAWFSRYLSQLWPFALTGYAEFGKGAVLVRLSSENGHTAEMEYISTGGIETDEEIKKLMQYDPATQFVLIIEKSKDLVTTNEVVTSFYRLGIPPESSKSS